MLSALRPGLVLLSALLLVGALPPAAAADGEAPPAGPRPVLLAQVGHAGTITAVAVSPNGRLVLTGSYDRTARLWNLQSGRVVARLDGTDRVVSSVAFSADETSVVTGHFDGTARLWDIETGSEVRRFAEHGDRVTAVACSSDNRWVLTGSWDATARLWDRATGKEVRRFQGHSDKVTSVALSADGRWVLTGSHDKTARLWDRETGAEARRFQGHTDRVTSVAFVPGQAAVVTASDDRTARLWDLAGGRELRSFTGHRDRLTSVAASPDGRWLATGSWDATARLWDLASGKEVRSLTGHREIVSSVAFTADGLGVLTGSHDLTARLWERETGSVQRVYEGRASAVGAVAISADARWLVTGHDDFKVTLWDREAGRAVLRFVGHTARIAAVALSKDARLVLTGSDDRSARIWDRESGKELRRLDGHTDKVTAVAFTDDGRFALTASHDKSARVWDVATGREVRRLDGHTDRVVAAAFSADGRWVVTASHDKTARLWDRETGRELQRYGGQGERLTAVALSADGRWVLTGGLDKAARLWDRESGRAERAFEGHANWVTGVAFSPGTARVLTSGMDSKAIVWDRASGKVLTRLEGHAGFVSTGIFSNDGRWVLTAGTDSTTRVWDAETGRLLCALLTFVDGTWAVVDPEGRYDASYEGRVEGLHWVVGREVIVLEQLMSGYYEPALLTRVLKPRDGPALALRAVPDFQRLGLFPKVKVAPPTGPDAVLTIDLEDQGGGIGQVVVKIDGAAIRMPTAPALAVRGRGVVEVPLAGHPLLAPGRTNHITVEVYNAQGTLRSRGFETELEAPGSDPGKPPEFWAVVLGVSDYAGEGGLDLEYPAHDADSFAAAIRGAAAGFFGPERTHVSVLSTGKPTPPTRANLLKALADARAAAPDDVFVLYLAGHGVTAGTPPDYYFPTQEATSLDLSQEADRKERAVSATELEDALREIPARRRVLVLDTCRSGAATAKLGGRGDDVGDYKRVVARVRQALSTYVLAGCAADRLSYEAKDYAHGLLTYALLEGMKTAPAGAVREGDVLEASGLLIYAARRVPQMAKGVGKSQDPLLTVPDNATPIDVGRLTAPVRAAIVLKGGKPAFGRPSVELKSVPDDPLGLAREVEQALIAAARAGEGPIRYHEGQDGPGVVRLSGRYTVEGAQVRMTMYVRRLTAGEPEALGTPVDLEGTSADRRDLATRMVTEAMARAAAR